MFAKLQCSLSTINVHDKFVPILLLNCLNVIKNDQMLKLTRKQVAIINDVYLCLYGTSFIILITS